MAATIPTIEPTGFIAGQTVKWDKSLSDYSSADSWALNYYIVKDDRLFTVTGSADGSGGWNIVIAATTTATYPPGKYTWQAEVSKAAEKFAVGTGHITITPNFATQTTGYDARSEAEKIRDGLLAAIEEGKDRLEISVSIATGASSRTRSFESREDIIRALRYWEQRVRKEQGRSNNLQVRFS